MKETRNDVHTQISLPNEEATLTLGALLARSLPTSMVICLSGDLGAGKTTLTRGFLRALGYGGAVKSPTFTLVESYSFNEEEIIESQVSGLHHFDLYRIEDPEELDFIGFEEYFWSNAHVMIEGPMRAGDRIGSYDFNVAISRESTSRLGSLAASSAAANTWLNRLINQNQFNRL